ncbi:hypothetical protein JG688_00015034 [Phytophthora aleatoria]|uniref:Transposase n=1 Tax=Phytophthora aleatoria TaxID=2496075 RepID=A0A8J5IZY6_9STRA|nr:hypothetical protein JG688_00015034 [Phytophthora aleatoria]
MPNLDDRTRRAIVNDILLCTRDGQVDRVRLGTFAKLGRKYERNERTIARIWKRYKAPVAAGHVGGDISSRIKGNSGRRGFDRAEVAVKVKAVPIQERRTIAATAKATEVSTGLLQRLLQENVMKRVTSTIKPALTPANMRTRIEHVLAFIDERTCMFEPMYDVVHVDEKWFYEAVDKNTYYTVEDEEPPPRHRRSKLFIQKTMFLQPWPDQGTSHFLFLFTVVRINHVPYFCRYDPHKKTKFNGKIGIWPFTEESVA